MSPVSRSIYQGCSISASYYPNTEALLRFECAMELFQPEGFGFDSPVLLLHGRASLIFSSFYNPV